MNNGLPRAPCGPARRGLRSVPALAVLAGLLGACASGGAGPPRATEPVTLPTRTAVESSFTNQPSSVRDTVLAEPRERIWAALPYVFRTLGVETTTLDARSYVIGNAGWRATVLHGTRLSSFLQCGSGILGPNADNYDVTMQLLVQLEPREARSTLLRVVLDANARPRSAAGAAIHCASLGSLEGRVVRLLDEGMARGADGHFVASGASVGGPGPGGSRPVGRLPSTGDVVRVGCAPSAGGAELESEGSYMGLNAGELLLDLGAPDRRVGVPVSRISSVQIREHRSRTRIGAIAFSVVGAAVGAPLGRQAHNPDGRIHFGPGAYTVIGGVLGGIAGALVGAIGGSLLDYDVWVDVTPTWRARYGSGAALAAPSADGEACPSFELAR
jgi:hypothetical protein